MGPTTVELDDRGRACFKEELRSDARCEYGDLSDQRSSSRGFAAAWENPIHGLNRPSSSHRDAASSAEASADRWSSVLRDRATVQREYARSVLRAGSAPERTDELQRRGCAACSAQHGCCSSLRGI